MEVLKIYRSGTDIDIPIRRSFWAVWNDRRCSLWGCYVSPNVGRYGADCSTDTTCDHFCDY